MFKALMTGATALTLTAVPVAASAAPAATNPATSLSVARAATPAGKSSKLTGAGIGPIAAGIIAVGIAVGVVLLVSDKEDNDSDSN
jgi:hypothetical protein